MAGYQDARKKNLDAAKNILGAEQQAGGGGLVSASMGDQGGTADFGGSQPQQQGPPMTMDQLMSQLASLQSVFGKNGGQAGAPQQKLPGNEAMGGGRYDGPMGAVPQHHGWAQMQQGAKMWTLALLGAFPSLRFSSGYRSPEANAAANGAPNSGHMRGWKADFSGSTRDLYAAAEWVKRMGGRPLLHDAGSGFHLDVSWENTPWL
jgi:hypothetical protein